VIIVRFYAENPMVAFGGWASHRVVWDLCVVPAKITLIWQKRLPNIEKKQAALYTGHHVRERKKVT